MVTSAIYPTPVGLLRIQFEGRAVTRLVFDEDTKEQNLVLPDEIKAPLDHYFAGQVNALEHIEVKASGTLYQQRVWRCLREIPPGETRSYSDIASKLNSHARAVGSANRLNPIFLIVPCHRVIAKTGALHGYAGGLERKEWLLKHEGYRCKDSITLRPQGLRQRVTI